MAIKLKEITSRKELTEYAKFKINLYKNCPNAISTLIVDDINSLTASENPAYAFCESVSYMAYKEDKAVGRVTGIINHALNKKTGKNEARFGWIDFIDDMDVSSTLIGAVEEWAFAKGMDELIGPLGFCDMDPEGALIEGFDELSTWATIYNFPYYIEHYKALGFVKDCDWIEFKIPIPKQMPEKHVKIANIVKTKYNLRIVDEKSMNKLQVKYGQKIFNLINDTYADFYGYSKLTPEQIDHYIKKVIPFINSEEIALIVTEDEELVGVGIACPSLSKALQKTKGKIFPFGWVHILKALKYDSKIVDLLLIAVHSDYQNKGVSALIFAKMFSSFSKRGYKYAESNPELEFNNKIHQQWQDFDPQHHKRRRSFRKSILATKHTP